VDWAVKHQEPTIWSAIKTIVSTDARYIGSTRSTWVQIIDEAQARNATPLIAQKVKNGLEPK
jgi:hypothetical protein